MGSPRLLLVEDEPALADLLKRYLERLGQAQQLMDEGRSVPEVSRELGVLGSTLHKAIGYGRLRRALKKSPRSLRKKASRPRASVV